MKWIPYGPKAWLLQVTDSLGDDAFYRVRRIAAELEQHPPSGLVEFVPGLTSVLLEFSPAEPDLGTVILPELMARFQFDGLAKVSTSPVRSIPMIYDGPDLNRVAEHNQLSVAEVIRLHAAPVYRVYLLGFSPGFPYLGDLDERLHTPRLPAPRPQIDPGSVGIGGVHTGIYTIASPGGWNIIGHTSEQLFDGSQAGEGMFLLKPGDRVRFVPHLSDEQPA
jgi:KipI family sensor histidine kinase inhibitor